MKANETIILLLVLLPLTAEGAAVAVHVPVIVRAPAPVVRPAPAPVVKPATAPVQPRTVTSPTTPTSTYIPVIHSHGDGASAPAQEEKKEEDKPKKQSWWQRLWAW